MVAVDPRLQILDFLHLCLRLLGMLPKVGHMGAEFLLFNLYLFIIYVEIAFQRQLAFDGFLKLFLCNHRKTVVDVSLLCIHAYAAGHKRLQNYAFFSKCPQ